MTALRRLYAKLPPDDELPELLRMHGTFRQLALVLGCSEAGLAYRCHKIGLHSPGRRGGRRVCTRCRVPSEDRRILRFTLAFYGSKAGERRTRGAGTIFLCEPCWRESTREARLLPVRRARAA